MSVEVTQPLAPSPFGVPASFSKQSGNGKSLILQKGQKNDFRLRPQVINEHAESAREIQAVVTSSLIVGQIFKASQDNINGISLTVESAVGSSVDDFESYANDAALQAVWVETDAADPALLETTIVKAGSQSMNIPMDATVLDEWVRTIGSTDYTGYDFDFDFQQSTTFVLAKISFFIGDGTNTKSVQLTISEINSWTHFEINEANMTVTANDATASAPNMAAITKIGFRLDDRHPTSAQAYIDTIIATPAPGSFQVKLWDFGVSLPTASVTTLDDATQYIELGDRGLNGGTVAAQISVPLLGGKKTYQLNSFVAGAALEIDGNTLLTANRYYGITIHYVDTNLSIYGPDSTQSDAPYYTNGYAFTAPDTSTGITQIGANNDLMFNIFSTQDVYVVQFFQFIATSAGVVAVPGPNSSIVSHIEDENMAITNVISTQVPASPDIAVPFLTRPMLLPKGGKFEVYYNDEVTGDTDTEPFALGGTMGFLYEPPTTNG